MAGISTLLNLGRKIGLENISQLNAVKKATLKGPNVKPFNAHFEFTGEQIKALSSVKGLNALEQSVMDTMKLGQKYSPKAYADDTKHIIDMQLKQFAPESYALSVTQNSSNDSILAKVKLLLNNAGCRLKVAAKSELAKVDLDSVRVQDVKTPNFDELFKQIKIKTDRFNPFVRNRMTQITLPKIKTGGLTGAMDVKVNSKYINKFINAVSEGKYHDVSDLVAVLKKLNTN